MNDHHQDPALDDKTQGVHGEGAVPASSSPADPSTGAVPADAAAGERRDEPTSDQPEEQPGSDQPGEEEPESA